MIRSGRLGTVRAVYAEVNWGRIETWHPAPAPFFDVGVLVDVGVYPLTLVTTMLGPARSVRAWGWELQAGPRDARRDAVPDRQPGPHRRGRRARRRRGRPADRELLRRPPGEGRPAASSSTATTRRSRSAASRTSTRPSRSGPYGEDVRAGRPRPAGVSAGRPGRAAWPRWPSAIAEGRPHRASAEQAAHVVDILEAAARIDGRRRPPDRDRVDLRAAGADAVGGHARRVKGASRLVPITRRRRAASHS